MASEDNQDEDIVLRLRSGVTISGNHPLVIIGPNGSGKTRLGVELAKDHPGERVPAQRELVINAVELQSSDTAERELSRAKNRLAEHYWQTASELIALLQKLKAKDAESAIAFRDRAFNDPNEEPPKTVFSAVKKFWHRHFPLRTLNFTLSKPTAISRHQGSEDPYALQTLSDGERVALYLAARVLDAAPGILIVDEPEVHLHTLLARRLWDGLEMSRPDCRFVYITHDLAFALSRKNAQFVILRPDSSQEVLPQDVGIPDETFESILGAASLSITANQIVFCEGRSGGIDEEFYSAWFNSPDVVVVPVGGSEQVMNCVEVFNTTETIKGMTAIGIIDRDYWPDEHLSNSGNNIHVLSVHEIEGLVCIRGVFTAVARYMGFSGRDASRKYERFLEKARGTFTDMLLNKQILERAKRRVELQTVGLLNSVSPSDDLDAVRSDFHRSLSPDKWGFDPETVFEEEKDRMLSALNGDQFLKYFPGKSYYSHAADQLKVQAGGLLNLVVEGLTTGSEPSKIMEGNLRAALCDHLPPIPTTNLT